MLRSYIWPVAAACVIFSTIGANATTVTTFKVDREEFGSGDVHTLSLTTNDSAVGTLLISCFSSGMQAHLNVKETIFPDALERGPDGVQRAGMELRVTHKVDTAAKASTNVWRMNMMKYNDAWLTSGVSALIAEMQKGDLLSLRLDRNGTIFRFALKESHEHLPKIQTACAQQGKKR